MKMRIAFYAALVVALIVWMEGPVLLLGLISPFVDLTAMESAPTYHAQIHRWHEAMFPTASALLFCSCIVGLIRRAVERPVLLQFAVAGHILALIPVATSGSIAAAVAFTIWMITCTLLVVFYPRRRQLRIFRSLLGWSRSLLVLAIVVGALLSVDIWMNLSRTLLGVGGEHLSYGHWLQAAYIDLLLILAGFTAASRLPGYQVLSGISGGTLVFLGVAALALPLQAGSWGISGGLLAIAAGSGYIGLGIAASRESARMRLPDHLPFVSGDSAAS